MKIGAQGFTVRAFAQDEAGILETMQKIAKIGYKTLQVSAFGPIAPEKLRDFAIETGLEIRLTHTNPDRILNEPEAVCAEHEIFGCNNIGIGMMPQRYLGSIEGTKQFLTDFDRSARILRENGKKLHYHNHNFEYEKFDGVMPMELIADTDPELWGIVLDTFWVQAGGRDPAAEIRRLEGRIDIAHFKDFAVVGFDKRFAPVLAGNLEWDAIFDACRDTGVREAMVEQDDAYGRDPFDELQISFENLKKARVMD